MTKLKKNSNSSNANPQSPSAKKAVKYVVESIQQTNLKDEQRISSPIRRVIKPINRIQECDFNSDQLKLYY